MSILELLIFLIIIAALWFGFYALGNYICTNSKYFKNSINKKSIIIISLIYIPIVMTALKEDIFFALGFVVLGPFLGSTFMHWLYPKLIKSKKRYKSGNFFNESYFYGYFGFLLLTFVSLLYEMQ